MCAGPTETRNQDPRPPLESFLCHDPMTVSNLANELLLKIIVFWGKSRFAWNFNNLTFGALFWKLSIPLYSCWWIRFNCELKSMFWLTGKKFVILNDFAPKGRKCKIGALEHLWTQREHCWTHIRGRNSNSQLVMSFNNNSIFIWFYRKTWKLKKWFFNFYETKVVNLI